MTRSPFDYDTFYLINKYYDTSKDDRFSVNEMNAYNFFDIDKALEINPILAQGFRRLSDDKSQGLVQGEQELMKAHQEINILIRSKRDLLLDNLKRQEHEFTILGYGALYENIRLQIKEQYNQIATPRSRFDYDQSLALLDEALRDPNLSRIEDFVDSETELLELDSEIFDIPDNLDSNDLVLNSSTPTAKNTTLSETKEKKQEPKPNFISAFFSGIVNFFKNLFKSSSNEKSQNKLSSSTQEITHVLEKSQSAIAKVNQEINASKILRNEIKGNSQAKRAEKSALRKAKRAKKSAKPQTTHEDVRAATEDKRRSTQQFATASKSIRDIQSNSLKKQEEGKAALRAKWKAISAKRTAINNTPAKPLQNNQSENTEKKDDTSQTSRMR